MSWLKKLAPPAPRAIFQNVAQTVTHPKQAVRAAVENLKPANAIRKVLPPGVGSKVLHAISVNVQNVKSKQACIKKNAVALGGTGLAVGSVFGPWGSVIGTAAGAAAGAGTALAKKDCVLGNVIGNPSGEALAAYTDPMPPGTPAPVSSRIIGEGERGASGFFDQIGAFFKQLGFA